MSDGTWTGAVPAPRRAARGWPVAAALALGAALLAAGLLAYYLSGDRFTRRGAVDLPGARLQLVEGQGAAEAGRLVIRALSPHGRALAIVPDLGLAARDFPVLAWRIEGLAPATRVRFIWATEADPQAVQGAALEHAGEAAGRLDLAALPGWSGRVIGVGLEIGGRLSGPLAVQALSLPRPEPTALELLDLWRREWTGFDDWWGTSINFVAYGTRQTLLAPLPAVALWAALAGALLAMLVRARPGRRQLALILLAAWLLLDLRWQGQLLHTLDRARDRYAGTSPEERARAAEDGEFYTLLQQVRAALPDGPVRLLLVTTGTGDTDHYLNLRGRYHLLPHKVLRLEGGRELARHLAALVSGEYLLVIGEAAGLDPGPAALEPVLERPPARLYRVP